MRCLRSLLSTLALPILVTGCASMAPPYPVSIDNVQRLKDSGTQSAKVGTFDASTDHANPNPLSIRASTMASPYGNSYGIYLAEALQQELSLANKFAANADIEISGTLLKNSLDGSGFSTGTADIEARFLVKRRGNVAYDQVKAAHHQWESSFAGAVAIPRARQEYSTVVQKLLAALYSDPKFQNAMK